MITMLRNLSTLQSNVNSRRQVSEISQRLNEASQEVTTGLKADRYKALGSRAEGAMVTRSWMTRLEGFAQSNATLDRRLEAMGQSLGAMRESLQTVLDLTAPNLGEQAATGAQIQAAARAALEQITGQANRQIEGVALFGGMESANKTLQPFDEVNPRNGTNQSPRDVVEEVIGGNPADGAEARAAADRLDALFTPGGADFGRYQQTFYNGTPREADTDGDGVGDERVSLSARIDDGEELEYGMQGDDAAFTDVIRGLSMLAAVDVSQFADREAQQVWTERAFAAMDRGGSAMLAAETRLGAQRRQLEDTMTAQAARLSLLQQKVNEVEGADPYEAATRLTQLQTQLEASYTVTARLSKLSFINYM